MIDHARRWMLWLPLAALLLASCATGARRDRDSMLQPLDAPAPSPPATLPLAQRIQWWESHIPHLSPEDRSEAYLRLADLRLEAERPEEARLAFHTAQNGHLSRAEAGHALYGIGLSYLLQDDTMAALGYFSQALPELEGSRAQDCAYLTAAHRGEDPGEPVDAYQLGRLARYLKGTPQPRVAARPAAASFVDLSRADWHAAGTRSNVDPMTKPFRITVHHSAKAMSGNTRSDTVADVRNIQQSHFQRGWADVGYHFLIDQSGRVVAGRPLQYQGAHAGRDGGVNHNIGNIGVCLLGDFSHEAPPAAQVHALEGLLARLEQEYGIARDQVFGHSHFGRTECPGSWMRSWLARYRGGAAVSP